MANFLVHEQDGGIVTLTMNQPETRNALTGNTAVPELVEACQRIAADPGVKVVILTGAGSAFSSGGNVKDMQRYSRDAVPPMIAAVNGAAIGAGCDLACMCDIRIAADSAKFAESFVKVGIVPGDGGAWLLPRAVGMSKAAEMSFTGEAIDAREALACGLVSRVVPAGELLDAARDLARRIATNPGPTLRLTKRLLREGQHLRLDSLLELSAAFQAMAHKTAQHEEAVAAFVEKRPPRFD